MASKDNLSEVSRSARGPLPFIILSATGQDVRRCANCHSCEDLMTPEMDLPFGKLMRAASRDDPLALTNRTLWRCDDVLESSLRCPSGIDIPAVIHALRREAERRGLDAGR
jgi:heterodisulfide reductase subunit C